MANPEHLAKLKEGFEVWNAWASEKIESTNPQLEQRFNRHVHPDLSGADLSGMDLHRAYLTKANFQGTTLVETNLNRAGLIWANFNGADLRGADLRGANLSGTGLRGADLRGANLSGTDLRGADLRGANLSPADGRPTDLSRAYLGEVSLRGANLSGAILRGANLSGTDLSGANLSEADLREALLVRTVFDEARLDGCRVYGTSVWDVSVKGASQQGLVITDEENVVTIDSLKLAQFIHLLLRNEEVRHIIDTITSKVVLILGRFTEERKKVLDTLRHELGSRDYAPIIFDFEKPASRDLTETIRTLASMARFVIADISDPKCIVGELDFIVEKFPSVPVQTIMIASGTEYALYEHLEQYPWVLPNFLYEDEAHLLASLNDNVIEPAEKRRKERTKTIR